MHPQLADAMLRAGIITEDQANKLRAELQQILENDFKVELRPRPLAPGAAK